ncbi:NADPH-dependent 2,4-dienoyl-CoA reductase/sulfur reductase-like enzyme [Actinomadura coerulea]|uniref:NADPH-dependent 2,4-dienoyl-CoA reductase/sulfur reductase-like enzyme n=1 Tax=Actinomadura coerulea TaxID=46159 RepID=A0A7X0KYY2_9ACTN|nr:FAD-dependent oxidoreductase [Actinomadura coerulea]MBB6395880.1 NADPH-dependent 2,4-dienoyl-CoA reductase/sulfur reductase-like enzyme [Actinomadura coerulea]GGQ30120.1 flavoprotein oxidoreductase [Actinomadura coerulea]
MAARERLLVIGGDAAGMSAASQARRLRGPDDLEIVAVERGRHASYSACGIPYFVGGVVDGPDALVARTPAEFRERGIDLRLRTEAVEIDTGGGRVRIRSLDGGGERWEPYDRLVIATGAVPVRPDLPGVDAEGVHGVQILDDGVAIRRAVEERSPRRAVVVGGGYIGLEMAEAMVMRGLEVSLVDVADQPMRTLDPDMGAIVAEAMRGIGVRLYLGEPVEGFDTSPEGRVTAVRTRNHTLPADLVVLGLGVRPAAGLAERAGIETGPTGGIVTDRRMRTRTERVWAAGDCVETRHLVSGAPVAIALGTHANKQGRVAGINLGGGYATFPGVVGTAVSKICRVEVARTGLNEAEAAAAGFETLSAAVESTTRAGYIPGAAAMTTKLIAERRSGRLLGAQIVGEENAAKRVDGLAIALWNGMTVEEMTGLDLGYAPPFAPVWDPVLVAARKAADAVERDMRSGS